VIEHILKLAANGDLRRRNSFLKYSFRTVILFFINILLTLSPIRKFSLNNKITVLDIIQIQIFLKKKTQIPIFKTKVIEGLKVFLV
jgi:hypothetical protein